MSTQIQCLIVGDRETGKSALLQSFMFQTYKELYRPTGIEHHYFQLNAGKQLLKINAFDTSGTQIGVFSNIRKAAYTDIDVIILCFSLVNQESFTNISNVWNFEIKQLNPTAIVFLVGNFHDQIEQTTLTKSNKSAVQLDQVHKVVQKFRFQEFIQCSALTHYNIHYLFNQVVKGHLQRLHDKKSKGMKIRCNIF